MQPHIVFASLETLIDVLDSWAVDTVSVDGATAGGILRPWKPHLFRDGVYMVGLYDVLTDELVMSTDIRNLATITLP
jgi:hypothetical protein